MCVKNFEKTLNSKWDIDEAKKVMQNKVDVTDFKAQLERLNNSVSSGNGIGGAGKGNYSSGIKVLIK